MSLVLQVVRSGIAYLIRAGMGIVLTAIAAAVFFKQLPGIPPAIGMVLILAGETVINVFLKTAVH